MLAIRLQRVGRKGYAEYRIVAQDAQRSPASGRVVANLGNYNPHTKAVSVDTEKAQHYLDNGAQPSERIVALFKKQKGVKLPAWVDSEASSTKRAIKNPEKLRKNQPKEEPAEAAAPADAAAAPESDEAESKAADDAEAPAESAAAPEPEEEKADA